MNATTTKTTRTYDAVATVRDEQQTPYLVSCNRFDEEAKILKTAEQFYGRKMVKVEEVLGL